MEITLKISTEESLSIRDVEELDEASREERLTVPELISRFVRDGLLARRTSNTQKATA